MLGSCLLHPYFSNALTLGLYPALQCLLSLWTFSGDMPGVRSQWNAKSGFIEILLELLLLKHENMKRTDLDLSDQVALEATGMCFILSWYNICLKKVKSSWVIHHELPQNLTSFILEICCKCDRTTISLVTYKTKLHIHKMLGWWDMTLTIMMCNDTIGMGIEWRKKFRVMFWQWMKPWEELCHL